MSTDALSKLSMGEVVIKRQRMNPVLTRLRSFDRYCFRLPETPDLTGRRLPEAPFFSVHDEFFKIKPRSEGNIITEKIREDTAEKENSVSGGPPVEEEADGMKEGQEVGLVES